MTTPGATLASIWIDEGQSSPMKGVPTTPSRITVGVESNGDANELKSVSNHKVKTEPNVSVTVSGIVTSPHPKMSPMLLPKTVHSVPSPMIIGSPHGVGSSPLLNVTHSPTLMPGTVHQSPSASWSGAASSGRKRRHDFSENELLDSAEKKRGKRLPSSGGRGVSDKGGKGLRHFSMKVCEKVQQKGTTSYNEVADELVAEFSDPDKLTPTDQAYDQKNIRRRVYDALNVLMAMNIISKEKKEIKWIGLPTNSAQECQQLEEEKRERLERIRQKRAQLQELIIQQIAFRNLVQRNKELEKERGSPPANSAIHLPFLVVNTNKKTVIDCSISNDKFEYLFNFDNTFEIHDDMEILKRLGMAFGLERGMCSEDNLRIARTMVPKALEPYVVDMSRNGSVLAGPSGVSALNSSSTSVSVSNVSPLVMASNLMSPVSTTAATTPTSPQATSPVPGPHPRGVSRTSSMTSYTSDSQRTNTQSPCSFASSPQSPGTSSESSRDGFMDTEDNNKDSVFANNH